MISVGAVSYGLLLLSVSGLTDAFFAAAQQLQRQHPQFGKCTAEDFIRGADSSSPSFLQEETPSSSSDEECMQLLSEQDSIFASGLADAAAEDEYDSEHTTDSLTAEEAVALATQFLQRRRAAGAAVELKAMKKSMALLSNAAKDSTVFVLGLGIHLHSIAKMAKNVIVVETDYSFCREFLGSKSGECVMQQNVHIYCPQPASSRPKNGAEANEAKESFDAAEDLTDDLMKQQFGDVPASTLVVLGSFAVTKLLLMERFLDQSSVILARSRISAEGLKAISSSFRVLASFEPDHRSSSHSVESFVLLQRLFTPPVHRYKWMNYATEKWELRDNTAPLTLWSTVYEAVQPIATDESVNPWKRKALLTYLDVHADAAATGSDEEWKNITSALESILNIAGKGERADSVLEQARESALRLAWNVASISGLEAYFQLMLDTLSTIQSEGRILIHAVICHLVAETGRLTASSNILDKVKDAVEEACELAEENPQLLLPALRLILGGMYREESMVDCLRILVNLKQGISDTDVSALVEEAGK